MNSQQREKPQINYLSSHLDKLEKEKPDKPKSRRRKEIIEIRAEINKIENRKSIQKKMKTKLVL